MVALARTAVVMTMRAVVVTSRVTTTASTSKKSWRLVQCYTSFLFSVHSMYSMRAPSAPFDIESRQQAPTITQKKVDFFISDTPASKQKYRSRRSGALAATHNYGVANTTHISVEAHCSDGPTGIMRTTRLRFSCTDLACWWLSSSSKNLLPVKSTSTDRNVGQKVGQVSRVVAEAQWQIRSHSGRTAVAAAAPGGGGGGGGSGATCAAGLPLLLLLAC